MFRMIIQLDKEKILREQKYELEAMYCKLDKVFYSKHFLPIETKKYDRIYQGTDDYKDFGRMGCIYLALKKQEWFMNNVSVWLLLESDSTVEPYDFSEEDLLAHCCRKLNAGG